MQPGRAGFLQQKRVFGELQGFRSMKGFRVEGLGFRVGGLGFRVEGLGFGVEG